MIEMAKFVQCQHCDGDLAPVDVLKWQTMDESPLIALLLQCPHCDKKTKAVTNYEALEGAKIEASRQRFVNRNIVKKAHSDMEDLIDIAFLQEIWAHKAPIREMVMNKCGCKECYKRLYVSEL